MTYYREANGDYIATFGRLFWSGDRTMRECRAPAIQGLATSVQTTAISAEQLALARRVERFEVPEEWLKAIGECE